MKFSIITPTYNSAVTIASTIESVLSQADVALEYIIIDGASTDGTLEFIKEYAEKDHRIKWVSETDEGIADAFNKGLSMATGDWVGIINSDDCYAEEALNVVSEAIENNPDVDVIHGNMVRLDETDKPVFMLKPAPLHNLWRQMALNHPATFVRQSAYEKVGGFDKSLQIAMDYDLVLRLYKSGAKFHYVDKVLAEMRYGGASDKRLWKGLEEIYLVSTRQGYPKWKAAWWLGWRCLEGALKRILRRAGLQKLQMLHPRFRSPN